MKVLFVREFNSWFGKSVEYIAIFENGKSYKLSCSEAEWLVIEIKGKLIETGADKDLLNEFEDAVKAVARNDV